MVGITGYEIAVPYRRLDAKEILDCWKNTALRLIQEKQARTMVEPQRYENRPHGIFRRGKSYAGRRSPASSIQTTEELL